MKLALKSSKLTQQFNVLCLKGYTSSESPVTKVEFYLNDSVLLGEADLGWRHINPEKPDDKYSGWVFETALGEDVNLENILITASFEDGQSISISEKIEPLKTLNTKPAAGRKISLESHEAQSSSEVIQQRENIIFLAIHNLDIEERVEKLRTFEKINAYLKKFNWRLLVIHHSPFEIESSLDYVQFKEIKLDPTAMEDGQWEHIISPQHVHEAVQLMHGFSRDTGENLSLSRCFKRVLEEALIFHELVKLHKPYSCMLWHEWNSFMHLNKQICHKYDIPCFLVHEGFLPETLSIDKVGEMAESWPATNAQKLRELPLTEKDMGYAQSYLKYASENNLDRKPQTSKGIVKETLDKVFPKNKTVLFYAGVNDWMTGMLPVWWDKAKVHSEFFIDSYDALDYLLDLCEKNDWYLLFKPHPNIQARFEFVDHPRMLMLSSPNIIECIEQTDVVITLLSTVSYVSMIHQKPVVLLGNMPLSDSGCVYEANKGIDIEQTIHDALSRKSFPEMLQNWQKHIAALLKYYLFPYSDKSQEIIGKTFKDAARFLLKNSQGQQSFLNQQIRDHSKEDIMSTNAQYLDAVPKRTSPRIYSNSFHTLEQGVDEIIQKISTKTNLKIAIYGGGKHTQKLLNYTSFKPHSINCILDDFATGELSGIPIKNPSEINGLDIDAIVISSDSIEDELYSKAKSLVSQNIPVFTIYSNYDKLRNQSPSSQQLPTFLLKKEYEELLKNHHTNQSQFSFFHNLYRIAHSEGASFKLQNLLLKCAEPFLENFKFAENASPINSPSIIKQLQQMPRSWEYIEENISLDDFAQYYHDVDYPKKFPKYTEQYSRSLSRKAMEHYISFKTMNIKDSGTYLDIAASNSPVHDILELNFEVADAYYQDINYESKSEKHKISSPASKIPLQSNSLDGITLHNSWEHFEGDEDIKCIEEAGRLLKKGGKLCILPLAFTAETQVLTSPLIWNTKYPNLKGVPCFDQEASIHINEDKLQRQEKTYSVEYFGTILSQFKDIFEFKIYYFPNIHNDNNKLKDFEDESIKIGSMKEFPYLVLLAEKK